MLLKVCLLSVWSRLSPFQPVLTVQDTGTHRYGFADDTESTVYQGSDFLLAKLQVFSLPTYLALEWKMTFPIPRSLQVECSGP